MQDRSPPTRRNLLAKHGRRPISALPRKQTFEGVALFGIPVGQEWRVVDDEMVLGLASLARVSERTCLNITP
jgi:hypothetical protein